jgi:AcrR family transcriptional regulator
MSRKAATPKKKASATIPAPAVSPADPSVEPGDEAGARPTRQRTTQLRQAMLETAAQMFADKGYLGTNLRDIADALGMSRPGLYYHFPSKEKLLEAIIEELTLSSERELARIALEKQGAPEEALRLVVRTTTMWLLDHRIFFRVLDRSESDLPAELRASNEASKRKNLAHLVGIIERGIAVGRFRPLDPHIAALAIAGMRNWAAWWYKPGGRLTATEIADMLAEMAVRSVRRVDAHRSRSERIEDAIRILREDVSHLDYLIKE